MRRLAPLVLVVVACGGTADTASPTTAAPTTTVIASTTVAPGATTTTSAATTTTVRVRPEGDQAPDFTVQLGEGGTFTLSEHGRPVYLLFWAEW